MQLLHHVIEPLAEELERERLLHPRMACKAHLLLELGEIGHVDFNVDLIYFLTVTEQSDKSLHALDQVVGLAVIKGVVHIFEVFLFNGIGEPV